MSEEKQAEEVARDLLEILPAHAASLTLQHNEHKNYYETVSQRYCQDDWLEWVSDQERLRAIETDEIWTAQWYPATPSGFYTLGASTLEALLAALARWKA